MKSTLLQQIQSARKEVRHMKKTNPHLFPEYEELLSARQNLKDAKLRLQQAEAMWNQLGSKNI